MTRILAFFARALNHAIFGEAPVRWDNDRWPVSNVVTVQPSDAELIAELEAVRSDEEYQQFVTGPVRPQDGQR